MEPILFYTQLFVQEYGYQVRRVQPVPGGTVGETYSVDDLYFLKVYNRRLSITQRCTAHLQEQLAVLDILQKQTPLEGKICYPIPTCRGDYFVCQADVIVVLFNFISGQAIGYANPYTAEEARQLRVLLADLHGADPALFDALCPKETFSLDWCAQLAALLQNQTPALPDAFRRLLLPYHSVILDKIHQTQALAHQLIQAPPPYVLCHTDIHGGNLMRDTQGKLYLVDWENILLAPREADLFAFCQQPALQDLTADAHPIALLFYILRRDLEDIHEFLSSLLERDYTPAQQEEVYGHLQRILQHLKDTPAL